MERQLVEMCDNAISHLLEWLKTQTKWQAGKDVEPLELSYFAGESVKWYSYLEKQFGHFLSS